MGTIREESSHSLLNPPKVFLSARLRLLQPDVRYRFSSFLPILKPFDLACYSKIFRLSARLFLSNRSSRTKSQGIHLHSILRPSCWWKDFGYPGITFSLANFPEPKFHPIFRFPEPINQWTFDSKFVDRWTLKASFWSELQLFPNADPEIRMIKF